jgi:uncharacterized membrane protein
MNIVLWFLQVIMGLYFFSVGVMHFIVPPGLPGMMAWMYELSTGLHTFAGIADILGGLGLILPGLTKIQTRLTPLAGAGLVLVMVGAVVWHLQRGEMGMILLNLTNTMVVGFIAYGRWRLSPLPERSSS